VISFILTSLDRFYQGMAGELDWQVVDAQFSRFAADQLDEASALLFGRSKCQHMAAYSPTTQALHNDPGITSRMNRMTKVVYSSTPSRAELSGRRLSPAVPTMMWRH